MTQLMAQRRRQSVEGVVELAHWLLAAASPPGSAGPVEGCTISCVSNPLWEGQDTQNDREPHTPAD